MLPGGTPEEQTLKKKGNTVITLGISNNGFNFALSKFSLSKIII